MPVSFFKRAHLFSPYWVPNNIDPLFSMEFSYCHDVNLNIIWSPFQYIPMPVLYGVFLYMGVSSLHGMQIVNRILIWFMPQKYQPDYMYLRHVRTTKVHLFTFIQVLCLIILWIIKSIKKTSIAFPIMVWAPFLEDIYSFIMSFNFEAI